MLASSKRAGIQNKPWVGWGKSVPKDAKAIARGPGKMLREQRKKTKCQTLSKLEELRGDSGPKRPQGTGGQVELRPWLALAKGPPGS